MTDAERTALNERIALLRGWTKETDEECEEQGWKNPSYMRGWFDPTGEWQHRPPNYLDEWEHAGPLLGELTSKYREITIHEGLTFVHVLHGTGNAKTTLCWLSKDEDSGGNDYVPEAIARAWLAWKERG